MNFSEFDKFDFFRFSPKVQCMPLVHGDGIFSECAYEFLLNNKIDAIALPLPVSFKNSVFEGILYLPEITIAGYFEPGGKRFGYAAISPCNAVISAAKIGFQEKIPVYFIDFEVEYFSQINPSICFTRFNARIFLRCACTIFQQTGI